MSKAISPKDIAKRYNRSEKRVRQIARETIQGHQRNERWTWQGWDDPDLKPLLARLENGERDASVDEWDVIVSSKNQVTLPVAALAQLTVKSGDKLRAVVRGRSLLLLPHPVSWVEYLAGSLKGLYGQTKEDVDAYLREVRGDWEPNERSDS